MQRTIFGGVVAVAITAMLAVSAYGQDHMKCYKIKDPVRLRGTPPPPPSWLDLNGPEFGNEQCKIVGGFRLFCTPVTKTVTAPIDRNTGVGYSPFTPNPVAGAPALTQNQICYKIKCLNNAVPNPDDPHPVFDQFGNRDVNKFRPHLLCGPAETGQRWTIPLMNGAMENPANGSAAVGSCDATLNGLALTMTCTHNVLAPTAAHVHSGLPPTNGPIEFPFASPVSPMTGTFNMSIAQYGLLTTGALYVNVHSNNCGSCPGGEIRGWWELAP